VIQGLPACRALIAARKETNMASQDAKLRIYIGWDSREDIAYQVARQSILENASIPVEVHPIKRDELIAEGLYTREVDPLASTEFTYSRLENLTTLPR
jgi:hypothetical protein